MILSAGFRTPDESRRTRILSMRAESPICSSTTDWYREVGSLGVNFIRRGLLVNRADSKLLRGLNIRRRFQWACFIGGYGLGGRRNEDPDGPHRIADQH